MKILSESVQTMKSSLLPYLAQGRLEAGCDEAGRGCLAGPVFAAAVILQEDVIIEGLNDSKKLSAKKRELLREVIQKEAKSFAVFSISNTEIDRVNILKASFYAMHGAIKELKIRPSHLLIDGNRFIPFPSIEHTCIIEGDGIYASIAAASIMAKTYRDEYMNQLHEAYPQYGWDKNKGYATKEHREAILRYGITKHHRLTFLKGVNQLKLSLFAKS